MHTLIPCQFTIVFPSFFPLLDENYFIESNDENHKQKQIFGNEILMQNTRRDVWVMATNCMDSRIFLLFSFKFCANTRTFNHYIHLQINLYFTADAFWVHLSSRRVLWEKIFVWSALISVKVSGLRQRQRGREIEKRALVCYFEE